MNVNFKKIAIISILFFLVGVVGCTSNKKEELSSLLCNHTSNGDMAEIEDGYFFVFNQFLYYADKDNLETWVAVCNKPECSHEDFTTCNGALKTATKIWQNDNKLYETTWNMTAIDNELYVCEMARDGSGAKNVYRIPTEGVPSGHGTATFQDQFVIRYNYLDESGYLQERIICLEEDENGNVQIDTLYKDIVSNASLVMSGNECWGIRGENLLITTLYLKEGGVAMENLCKIENGNIEPLNLPDDIPLLYGHFANDVFTYYKQQEGFYQYNINTGEHRLLFENQLEDAQGFILSEDYIVERNKDSLKIFMEDKWNDMKLPEEVVKSNGAFYPIAIASDRIFFKMNVKNSASAVATGVYLYYMMLNEENPQLVFAGRIGEEFISEEETTVGAEDDTEFKEMTIFDNEDGILKVTGVRKGVDSYNMGRYYVDLFFEIGNSDRNYDIKIEALVNGIQCHTNMSLDTRYSETGNVEIQFHESTLKEYGVMDVYSFDEVTDIELFFYVNEAGIDGEEILKKSVHVYPNGEEAAVHYTREPQETDMVFVDNEKVKITVVGYETTKVENDTPIFFVENKTDQEIYFKVAAASINGAQDYSIWSYEEIQGGGCAFVKAILGDEYLSKDGMKNFWEEYDVTEIGTIQTFINIGYLDMGKNKEIGDPFVKELITLYPQGEEHARDDARPQQEMDVVLVDNDYIKITHIGYEENWWSDERIPDVYTKILVENKTDEILYSQIVASGNNGNIYNVEDYEIPHMLLSGTYYIQKTGNPISDVISKREFLYQVFDKDKNLVNQEYIVLYPLGEDAVKDYPTDLERMEEILVDNESFTIAVSRYSDYTDVSKKERITYADSWIELYFINKTDKILYFKMCDISINGIAYRTYGSNSTNVEEEAIVFAHGTLFASDIGSFQTLKDTNMTDVEEVEITFKVYEYQCEDTLFGEELGNVTVKFGPEK